jgi:hypothetical protein
MANSPKSLVPTITLPIAGVPTVVRFDYGTIDQIEQTTRLGFQEIADQFGQFMPPDYAPGVPPTREQISEAARRFKVGFAAKFVAGCLGATLKELSDKLPVGEIVDAFNALAPGFIDTFNAMTGSVAEKKGVPSPSTSGEPGPASTSGSDPASSSASAPASSDTSSASGAPASDGVTSGPVSSPQ